MAQEWRNWSQALLCRPAEILAPASVDEVRAAVLRARDAGLRLRVAGSGHSFSPIVPTTGVLLDLHRLSGILSIDREGKRATIAAGTKLADIGELLAAAGLALKNQGDIDKQAIAGAIATGTHGTGVTLGNLSSFASAFDLVTADGEIRRYDASSPEMLAALRISLGLLGVVTAITVDLDPAYHLAERQWDLSVDEVFGELDDLVASHRHFEFFWQPTRDVCECKALDPVSAGTVLEGCRTGPSYHIFPSERRRLFNEMEFSLPAHEGPVCFGKIRRLMQEQHPEVYMPVEYRTVAADDIWLSPHYGRAGVTISVHQAAHMDHVPFFRDCETIFREHGGRPHLGKLHGFARDDFAKALPRFEGFVALRGRHDREGMFLNDHLAPIFGEAPTLTRAA